VIAEPPATTTQADHDARALPRRPGSRQGQHRRRPQHAGACVRDGERRASGRGLSVRPQGASDQPIAPPGAGQLVEQLGSTGGLLGGQLRDDRAYGGSQAMRSGRFIDELGGDVGVTQQERGIDHHPQRRLRRGGPAVGDRDGQLVRWVRHPPGVARGSRRPTEDDRRGRFTTDRLMGQPPVEVDLRLAGPTQRDRVEPLGPDVEMLGPQPEAQLEPGRQQGLGGRPPLRCGHEHIGVAHRAHVGRAVERRQRNALQRYRLHARGPPCLGGEGQLLQYDEVADRCVAP
jgi:hypothetical protein